MRRVLLDTQAVLLWTISPSALPDHVRALLRDGNTRRVVSAVSVWELSIKQRLGKLVLPERYFDRLLAAETGYLPITALDGWEAGQLPLHHADPFDRMLIAQARRQGVPIVGSDRAFALYDVETIW